MSAKGLAPRPSEPGARAPANGLDTIFRELDQLFAAASCPRSTGCCRFRRTGRVPYVSPPEARRVIEAVMRRGGRLPRGGDDGDCPLLGEDGRCSIYPDRPFGCRTFFCGEATLPEGRRRVEVDRLAMRLRGLCDASGETGLVPLTTALAGAFGPDGRRRQAR